MKRFNPPCFSFLSFLFNFLFNLLFNIRFSVVFDTIFSKVLPSTNLFSPTYFPKTRIQDKKLLLDLSTISIVTSVLISMDAAALENGNPLVKHIYTADPSAHVFEDKVYVYSSHDRNGATRYDMKDYHVLSSENLVDWKDHGIALSIEDVKWAKNRMWAPDCVFKNGVYYFYFPAKDKENTFRIGVATSTSPTGPFIPEPSYIQGTDEIDPAVFIDDDGQAYLYWGGKSAKAAKLDDTMKQLSGDVVELQGVDYFYEAAWMQKRDSTYYLSYSTGKFLPDTDNHLIAYATSKSPLGPFVYQGIINGNVSSITNHHSTVEYKGQSYLLYHNADLSGGINTQRSVVADYLHFNDDGSVREVIQTQLGIGRYDGINTIEAENYSESQTVQKYENHNSSGLHLAFGVKDSVVFNNIVFGPQLLSKIQLKLTTQSTTGHIILRSKAGDLIAHIPLSKTDNSDGWRSLIADITPLAGTQDLSITFVDTESPDSVLRLDNFKFFQ